MWRRWNADHVMPPPSGRLLTPLLQVAATDDGPGGEFTGATEQNQLDYQGRFVDAGIGYDIWWIDAGWYDCHDPSDGEVDWCVTGTWAPDGQRFPNGLAAVGAAARSHGAQLLLWFEPERVFPGTALDREHPDWMLDRPVPTPPPGASPRWWRQRGSRLLDLGQSACRRWLVEHVGTLVEEYELGVYRQDFNITPLEFWEQHDEDEGSGLSENLHVQNYLEFFDALLERYPHLFIDSCASGGRRNDLETMRRAVPLHYTDYGYGEHPVKVDFQRTLYEWLPYFREMTLSWDLEESTAAGLDASELDSFAFHCALAPMLGLSLDIRRLGDYDLDLVHKMIAIWRRAAPLVLRGYYYALTPPGRTGTEWVGRQFCSADGHSGFVQLIRHARCKETACHVSLRRVRAERRYRFEEAESGIWRECAGNELAEDGFDLELAPRSGSIWFYETTGD